MVEPENTLVRNSTRVIKVRHS